MSAEGGEDVAFTQEMPHPVLKSHGTMWLRVPGLPTGSQPERVWENMCAVHPMYTSEREGRWPSRSPMGISEMFQQQATEESECGNVLKGPQPRAWQRGLGEIKPTEKAKK